MADCITFGTGVSKLDLQLRLVHSYEHAPSFCMDKMFCPWDKIFFVLKLVHVVDMLWCLGRTGLGVRNIVLMGIGLASSIGARRDARIGPCRTSDTSKTSNCLSVMAIFKQRLCKF